MRQISVISRFLFSLLLNVILWKISICQRRIVGGKEAAVGQFPFLVYIKPPRRSACTGFIIRPSWVVTAAHCIFDSVPDKNTQIVVNIIAGALDITLTQNAQKRINKNIIVHEDFNKNLGKNDICLIEVDQSFTMTNNVTEIQFSISPWPSDDNGERSDCYIAGWGLVGKEKETTRVHFMDTSAKHGKNSCPCIHQWYITKRTVCLPNLKNQGVCFGDAGSPLVCSNKVVGISHVVVDKRSCNFIKAPDTEIDCSNENLYGVYMYTCPYLTWISEYVSGIPKTPENCLAIVNIQPSIPFMTIVLIINKQFF